MHCVPYAMVPGFSVYYLRGGQGRPVLFVHGMGTNSWVWKHVFLDTPPGAVYYALDLPGHGGSYPAGDGSICGHAAVLLAFMEHLSAQGAVAVGHDMGGLVALEAALRAPSLFSELVLINVPLCFSLPEEMVSEIERAPLRAAEAFLSRAGEGLDDQLRGDLWRLLAQGEGQLFARDVRACLGYGVERLKEWRGRVLHLVSGPSAAAQVSLLTGRVRRLKALGHFPMLEAPTALSSLLKDLLSPLLKPERKRAKKAH